MLCLVTKTTDFFEIGYFSESENKDTQLITGASPPGLHGEEPSPMWTLPSFNEKWGIVDCVLICIYAFSLSGRVVFMDWYYM